MRRTTVLLDDGLADLLDYERRRQARSTAAVVREALETYLAGGGGTGRRLPFAALGGSGVRDTARKSETILAREWVKGGRPAGPGRRR